MILKLIASYNNNIFQINLILETKAFEILKSANYLAYFNAYPEQIF
jgi:hypothetical protein